MLVPMSDVTRLLGAAAAGDPKAAEQLIPLVYDELRRLAAQRLAHERPEQTLDATALVHEAFLRLAGDRPFVDSGHFFRVAAEAMRRILVDRARHKRRARHGGDRDRVPLADVEPAAPGPADDLVARDEALDRFAVSDPVKAELVQLRYFGGLPEEDAAAALGISRATASRYWAYARAWLIDALDGKSAELAGR
jgi:RNA polymerase sigma factor (TIGR02999 family)